MNTQHTAGPWQANLHHTKEQAGRTYGFIHANTCVPIAAVTLGVEGMPQDQGRANCHLIAAAPDLYTALEACLPWVEDHMAMTAGPAGVDFDPRDRIAYDKAVAALAKARGEP